MFGRRTGAEQDVAPEELVPETRAAGKGRPTPRRRDAEAERRARVRPPRSRKEAAERRRERMRAERERTRQAMVTGDDRGLPARDRGPVKRFVRERVDGRRTPLEFVMPAMIVLLFGSTILASVLAKGNVRATVFVTYGFYVLLIVVVLLALVYGRGLGREVNARFADSGENTSGAVRYGVMRAVTLRRLRMPKPRKPAGPVDV